MVLFVFFLFVPKGFWETGMINDARLLASFFSLQMNLWSTVVLPTCC